MVCYHQSFRGDPIERTFFAQPGAENMVNHIYFSFITLTTTGFGDLTPAYGPGRMLAAIEAIIANSTSFRWSLSLSAHTVDAGIRRDAGPEAPLHSNLFGKGA